jgi:hypothetical protein
MSHPHGTLNGSGPNDRGTTSAERFIGAATPAFSAGGEVRQT